jgi:hypothetical protein
MIESTYHRNEMEGALVLVRLSAVISLMCGPHAYGSDRADGGAPGRSFPAASRPR